MSPDDAQHPSVEAFFHVDTGSFSYVVHHADSDVRVIPVCRFPS